MKASSIYPNFQGPKHVVKLGFGDRFDHKTDRSAVEAFFHILFERGRAPDDLRDPIVAGAGAGFLKELRSVEPWHFIVEQDVDGEGL